MFFWSHVDVMENSKMLPSNRITHFSGWWSRPPLASRLGAMEEAAEAILFFICANGWLLGLVGWTTTVISRVGTCRSEILRLGIKLGSWRLCRHLHRQALGIFPKKCDYSNVNFHKQHIFRLVRMTRHSWVNMVYAQSCMKRMLFAAINHIGAFESNRMPWKTVSRRSIPNRFRFGQFMPRAIRHKFKGKK